MQITRQTTWWLSIDHCQNGKRSGFCICRIAIMSGHSVGIALSRFKLSLSYWDCSLSHTVNAIRPLSVTHLKSPEMDLNRTLSKLSACAEGEKELQIGASNGRFKRDHRHRAPNWILQYSLHCPYSSRPLESFYCELNWVLIEFGRW